MKILHTSDWHLGRYFHNVSLLDDQRWVLQQISDYIEQYQVDVVLIAGDLFDRSVPPVQAISLLDAFLNRMCNELECTVIMIPGNHDSAERLNFGAVHMAHNRLHILADLKRVATPVMVSCGEQKVAFFGVPYADPHAVNSVWHSSCQTHDQAHNFLVDKILATDIAADVRKVLISHCFVSGCDPCESERPLAIGGADSVSVTPLLAFDYVALGHLHGPQMRSKDTIRYSGSPLAYSFSEQHHNKSVCLLDLPLSGPPEITLLALRPKRRVRVLEGSWQAILAQAQVVGWCEDYLMVRLTDQLAILDPVVQLREYYPNLLHLEKTQVAQELKPSGQNAMLQRDPTLLFAEFYQQLTQEDLTEAQLSVLQEVVHQAQQQELADS